MLPLGYMSMGKLRTCATHVQLASKCHMPPPLPCIIQTTCRPEHLLQPLSHLDPAVTPVMVCRACDIVITVDATRNYEPACRPAIFHRKLTYVSRSFRPRESRHGSQENSRLFGIMALVSDFWLELGVPHGSTVLAQPFRH